MPLYDIKCDLSGQKFERFIKLTDWAEPIFCACGSRARRAISTPMFTVDHTDYSCPITDKRIASKSQHEENLKQHGCRVLETGERERNTAKVRAEEEAFERKVDDTVERTIESWPSSKKEQLHNELINQNLDVVVERK